MLRLVGNIANFAPPTFSANRKRGLFLPRAKSGLQAAEYCSVGNERRAQSSLEALAAFAFLLFALLALSVAARDFSSAFIAQSQNAGLRIGLAHEALLLDAYAWAAGSSKVEQNISAIPIQGKGEVSSRKNPAIREPVFSFPSQGGSGEIYVQKISYEPI